MNKNIKRLTISSIALAMLISQSNVSFATSNTGDSDNYQTVSNNVYNASTQSKPTTLKEILGDKAVEPTPSPVETNTKTNNEQIGDNSIISDFDDVHPGDWFYNDVMQAKKAKLVTGIGDNKFDPNATITYADFLTILSRIADAAVEAQKDGSNWYDKYIESARKIGVLDKDEKVSAELNITREVMIKYTCKVLGIEPYTGDEVIFDDVASQDTAYINAAYNEYLTEGSGRNEAGNKVFGFGQIVDRSELATMANRIVYYKKDPVAFKAERAEAREKAEQAYQKKVADNQTNYQFNGYSIPKEVYEASNKKRTDFMALLCNKEIDINYIDYSAKYH